LAKFSTTKINADKVFGYLQAIEDKTLASKALLKGFEAGSLVLRIFMNENLTGRKIGIVTGALRRSAFVDKPRVVNGKVTMTYGSRGVPYASIHEFGGQAGIGGSVNLPERRMFRDAAERSLSGIVQQIGIHAIKALKEGRA